MPGPYKVTLLYNFASGGWSESWYYNSTNEWTDEDKAKVMRLADARNGLVGYGVSLVGIRVSDLSSPRTVMTFLLDKMTTTQVSGPDQNAAAWLLKATGTNGHGNRQVWCRSIPDKWIEWSAGDNRFLPVGPLYDAVELFRTVIKQSPWSLQIVAPVKAAGTGTTTVTALAATPTGAVTLTLKAPVGLTDGQTLIVSGFAKPLSVLNGYYRPAAYTLGSATIVLRKAVSDYDIASYRTGGFVRNRVVSYTRVVNVNITRPGTRRTGGAFFVPAGHR